MVTVSSKHRTVKCVTVATLVTAAPTSTAAAAAMVRMTREIWHSPAQENQEVGLCYLTCSGFLFDMACVSLNRN